MPRKRSSSPSGLGRRAKRLIIPMILVVFVIVLVLFAKFFFVVQRITCTFDNNPCAEPVVAEISRMKGKSIFFIETAELETKLHAALPRAKDILFEKRPPNALVVTIQSFAPAFYIHSGPQYVLTNQAGTVIDQSESLPQGEFELTIHQDALKVGNTIDQSTFTALNSLVEELKKTSLLVTSIEYIDENQILLQIADNKTAVLKSGDIFSQLTTLQRILNDATMSERGHIFDVRFAHPVVKN